MAGGFTGLEVTRSTEIFTENGGAWSEVSSLPRPANGLRATTVNNMVYLLGRNILRLGRGQSDLSSSTGGDTDILQFDDSDETSWKVFSQMTKQPGIKLEVSTIDCRIVRNYIPLNESPSMTGPAIQTSSVFDGNFEFE